MFINTNHRPVVPNGLSTSPTSQHLLSQSQQNSKPKEPDTKSLVTEKITTIFQVVSKETSDELQLRELLEKSGQYLQETVTIFQQETVLSFPF